MAGSQHPREDHSAWWEGSLAPPLVGRAGDPNLQSSGRVGPGDVCARPLGRVRGEGAAAAGIAGLLLNLPTGSSPPACRSWEKGLPAPSGPQTSRFPSGLLLAVCTARCTHQLLKMRLAWGSLPLRTPPFSFPVFQVFLGKEIPSLERRSQP